VAVVAMLVLWVHMVLSPDVSNGLEALDARAPDSVLSAGAGFAELA